MSDGLHRDVDALLRRCVQCGLCLPHCATWLETGDDVQSPRGRLVLLGALLEGAAADAAVREAFDLCIGCRACESACPSGVPFSLLEDGGRLAGPAEGRAALPGVLLRRLDRPAVLAGLRPLGDAARTMLGALAGPGWRRRFAHSRPARLLGTLPRAPRRDADLVAILDRLTRAEGPWRPPPAADARSPLLFFRGCANEGLLPDTSRRLLDLCRAAGFAVTVPRGQDCCGALAAHDGRAGRAALLHRRNRAAFAVAAADVPVLAEAAGCGLELEHMDPPLPGPVRDASQVLATAALPPLARLPLKVAVHDPCHARHGRGIVAEPRALLRRIPGITVLEPLEAEVCCGSGGAWSLHHPDLADALGRRKARLLAATGADLVVTTNPGCLGQIADGLALEAPHLPILPLTDLLWYAAARAPKAAGRGPAASGAS
ncbi:MAG TPA: (Fe-S)-binding protein [Candidatus Krumholzibacteria bacterium]|nr:(Fe-S)-binding protein [Candidatus Krumholzibacteria bacterium]